MNYFLSIMILKLWRFHSLKWFQALDSISFILKNNFIVLILAQRKNFPRWGFYSVDKGYNTWENPKGSLLRIIGTEGENKKRKDKGYTWKNPKSSLLRIGGESVATKRLYPTLPRPEDQVRLPNHFYLLDWVKSSSIRLALENSQVFQGQNLGIWFLNLWKEMSFEITNPLMEVGYGHSNHYFMHRIIRLSL